MITKNLSKCPRCGKTTKLVKHHISYIPEVTEYICGKCNSKERRSTNCRGPKIILTYPQNSIAVLGKDVMRQFNSSILELELAPISPVGVIFPYGMSFSEVRQCLDPITENLKLREEEKSRQEISKNNEV